MIKTPILERLCEELKELYRQLGELHKQLGKIPPGLDRKIDSYVRTINKNKKLELTYHISRFCRSSLNLDLREISRANPQLKIDFNVFEKDEIVAGPYLIKKERYGQITAKENLKDQSPFDYDSVVFVDGLPVIFHIMYGKCRKPNNDCPSRIEQVLLGIEEGRIIDPLVQLFEKDVGLVFLLSRDSYNTLRGNDELPGSEIFAKFIESGGCALPLYATSDQIVKDIASGLTKRNILYKFQTFV